MALSVRRHSLIPYALAAFLAVVILLIGLGLSLAITFSFNTEAFLQFKQETSLRDFISGADMLFSIVFFISYFLLSGLLRYLLYKTGEQLRIKQAVLLVASLLIVFLSIPFSNTVEIYSSYSFQLFLVYILVVFNNLIIVRKDLFESSIDLIFSLFQKSLYTSIAVYILSVLVSLDIAFSFEFVKLFILIYLFTFFNYLAGNLAFYSLIKTYYSNEK